MQGKFSISVYWKYFLFSIAVSLPALVHLATLGGVRLEGLMSATEVLMSTASVSTVSNTGAYSVYWLVQPTTLVSTVYCVLQRGET